MVKFPSNSVVLLFVSIGAANVNAFSNPQGSSLKFGCRRMTCLQQSTNAIDEKSQIGTLDVGVQKKEKRFSKNQVYMNIILDFKIRT